MSRAWPSKKNTKGVSLMYYCLWVWPTTKLVRWHGMAWHDNWLIAVYLQWSRQNNFILQRRYYTHSGGITILGFSVWEKKHRRLPTELLLRLEIQLRVQTIRIRNPTLPKVHKTTFCHYWPILWPFRLFLAFSERIFLAPIRSTYVVCCAQNDAWLKQIVNCR